MNDKSLVVKENLEPRMMPAPRIKVGQDGMVEPVEPDPAADLDEWRDQFLNAFGTTEGAIAGALFNQLVNVLHTDPTKPVSDATANLALALLQRLAPANELEAMLCVQLIVAHIASMDASRRALHVDQSAAGRQQYLGLARKLMTLFTAQTQALSRLRGNPIVQKVVIERVNVAPGGQAVVGAIAGRSGGPGRV
jgi:hypothetical protein